MNTSPNAVMAAPDRLAGRLVACFILAYRRFISPRKGFRCAHQRLHRNGSCSDFGLLAMRTMGLAGGLAALRGRFSECRDAARAMSAALAAPHAAGASSAAADDEAEDDEAEDENPDRSKRKRDDGFWSTLFEGGCLGVTACAALPGAAKPSEAPPPADSECLGFDFTMPDCSFDLPDCGCSG